MAPSGRSPRPPFRSLQIASLAVLSLLATLVALNGRLGSPRWEVARLEGDGILVADGRPVPVTHREELAHRIRPGVRLRVPDRVRLEIRSAGSLALELESGADATVPRLPGRWWGRRISCELAGGVARIVTGPAFRGARLTIETPGATFSTAGGALLVAGESQGTRLAVLDGVVRAGSRGSPLSRVPPGTERFYYSDAHVSKPVPLRSLDRSALRALRARFAGNGPGR